MPKCLIVASGSIFVEAHQKDENTHLGFPNPLFAPTPPQTPPPPPRSPRVFLTTHPPGSLRKTPRRKLPRGEAVGIAALSFGGLCLAAWPLGRLQNAFFGLGFFCQPSPSAVISKEHRQENHTFIKGGPTPHVVATNQFISCFFAGWP